MFNLKVGVTEYKICLLLSHLKPEYVTELHKSSPILGLQSSSRLPELSV